MKAKHRLTTLAAVLLLAAMIAGCSTTAPATRPTAEPDWQFHDIVDVAFVQQYAKVPTADNVMIIDARPKRAKYDKGHIPGAISIPDRTFDKMVDKLPQDKETPLMFYCEGYT